MKTFKKILFPVDLSEVSLKVVPLVASMAKQFHAEIHLLFVARNLGYFSDLDLEPTFINEFENNIIQGAERRIEIFSEAHFKKYPNCKTLVVLGDAAEEIIKYVESKGVDLIIMGTHGRKGIDRIFFGSVAEKVIKMSPVPVLSTNPYRVSSKKTDTTFPEN